MCPELERPGILNAITEYPVSLNSMLLNPAIAFINVRRQCGICILASKWLNELAACTAASGFRQQLPFQQDKLNHLQ
jgi:hypothetical protein